MIRTQIQLEESTYSEIKSVAATLGCSVSEFIRRSLKASLPAQQAKPKIYRSLKAVGRYRSGLRDLSTSHDEYLPDEW
jgi:negative regulator of replication initiation